MIKAVVQFCVVGVYRVHKEASIERVLETAGINEILYSHKTAQNQYISSRLFLFSANMETIVK